MLSWQHLRRRGCCPCARVKDNARVAVFHCIVLRCDCNNIRANGLALRLAASAFERRPFIPHAHPLPPPSPHLSATVLPLQSASSTVISTPEFTGEL